MHPVVIKMCIIWIDDAIDASGNTKEITYCTAKSNLMYPDILASKHRKDVFQNNVKVNIQAV